MKNTQLCVAAVALLFVSAGATAAESAGTFANVNGKSTTTTLPDGRTEVISHYTQITSSNKADDPVGNTESACVGRFVQSGDGAVLSASGICFSTNVSGDGGSWWWKADEIGTSKCPDMCGSFGWIDGHGKFKGISGMGTWVRTAVLANSAMGTYKSTYSLKK